MRIVYVEDDMTNVYLIERIAGRGQHEVISYPRASEALAYLEHADADIILADHRLEGNKTGLDMVRELRIKGCDIPIIAISAHAGEKACLEAGCNHFFPKPIEVFELMLLIQDYSELTGK